MMRPDGYRTPVTCPPCAGLGQVSSPISWKFLDGKPICDRLRKGYGVGPKPQRSCGLATCVFADRDDDGPVAGTNLIHAATYRFSDSERDIPARPFLGVRPECAGMIRKTVAASLAGAVRG